MSGCVVSASMCACFVHVWAGEGSEYLPEWGTRSPRLCACGVSVCVCTCLCVCRRLSCIYLLALALPRARSRAHSRLLSSLSPLCLSLPLTHTHSQTQFSIPPSPSLSLSHSVSSLSLPLLSPSSLRRRQSLSPPPRHCQFCLGGGYLPPLWGAGENIDAFLFPSTIPWVVLPRACRQLLSAASSLEEGSGEGRTPSPMPMMPSAVRALAP